MSSLKINGQEFNDVQLVKLKKDKADEAIARLNSGAQGADDVVFKVGDDTFVASGRDLFAGKPIAGKPFMGGEGVSVELDGKQAEVLAWDNQANNGKECAKWSLQQFALAPVAVPAFLITILKLKVNPLWTAAASVVGVGAAVVGGYFYGASRKIDVTAHAEMGTVMQKNTQAQGGWGEAFKRVTDK
jgi:hypothetical protein